MSLDHLYDFFNEGDNKSIQEHTQEETNATQPILTARNELESKSKALYEELSENIRISEELRHDITKSINAGQDEQEILKKCLKCISLMTGEKLFYTQNIKKLDI